MNPSTRRGLRTGLTLCGIVIAGIVLLMFGGGRVGPSRIAAATGASKTPAASYADAFGGPFNLTDQNGRAVTNETLAGKPFAIFFGFTRCPAVCPTTISRLARLRRQLGSDGDKFNIVFVSVDPAHDKRKDIASFLSMFDTPVIGLTGSPVQLAHIEKAYDVVVLKVPLDNGDYTIDHSSSVFLMGKRGEFVSTLDTQEPDATAVQKLRRLIAS